MENEKIVYTDINFNFIAHPLTGDLVKVTNTNAIKQSVKTLVMSNFYSRGFHPDIGSNLNALLFEPMDDFTSDNIGVAIATVLKNYENRIRVEEVRVVPDFDLGHYAVSVYFFITSVNNRQQLDFILERA